MTNRKSAKQISSYLFCVNGIYLILCLVNLSLHSYLLQSPATKWYKRPHAHKVYVCHILLEHRVWMLTQYHVMSFSASVKVCLCCYCYRQQLDKRLFYTYIFPTPLVDEWSPAWQTRQQRNSNAFQIISCLHRAKEQKELVLLTSHSQPEFCQGLTKEIT